MALFDLYNKEVKVGDKVVLSKDWSKGCDYLVVGIVKSINTTSSGDTAIIECTNNGRWNYEKDTTKVSKWEKQIVYKNIGRLHNNLLIIS